MCRKLTWLVSLVLLLSLGHSASAATNPYPPDGATGVSTDVTLSWNPEYGAVSYDVYFGTYFDPNSPLAFIGNQSSSDYSPGGLEPGTTYFWRINEINDLNPNSPWEGSLWSFTTTKGPKKATNPSPTDGAEDVPLDTGLSWDPGSGATSQDVYFDTSSSPPFVDNQTQSDYSPGTLEPDTRYWWQIDTVRQIGEWFTVVTGDLWSFTTAIVEATDPYPADGAEDVPLDIVLSWNPGSGATSQDVYFGTSSSPPLVASQTQSDYSPGTLEPDTRYWWHIDEIEADGTVVTGDVWSFTTIIVEATNPYPADGAEDVSIDVALSWTAGFGATSHDVYFGTSSPPAFIYRTANGYSPGGLEPGTTYFWQINEVVPVMEGPPIIHEGPVWEFTTMSGPVEATNSYPADGAEDVPIDVVLSWDPGSGATSQDVYFGTSSPPPFIGNQTASYCEPYYPYGLEPGTTYFWRIDTVIQTGEFFMVHIGDLWSFTTGLDPDEPADFECFFYQMDFNLSGTAYIDTEWGSVDFTFTGQEPIMYFNLTVNGTWQVQNIPVLSIEGVGVEQTMTFYFDLGTQRGVDVTSLSYDYAFTPNILDTPPGVLEPAPVADDYIAMWPGFGGLMPPLGPARPLIGGEAVSSDKKYAHKNFPNQECGPRECVPAAVSNSLQFLNNENDLGLNANDVSIETMKEATGWENGSPLDTWWEIKKKYMEDNGYPITTRKTTDMNDVVAQIDAGQDVEITESWLTDPNDPNSRTGHVTALIGITPLKDGRYSLDVADDRKQGEPGGCDNPRPYTYDPKTGTIDEAGYITKFEYAVVECPYILLDDFELYGDDFGNRIFETWIDGLGYIYPLPGQLGNGTGAIVGNSEAPIAEQTIVYEGSQSMPFSYDNSGSYRKAFYSETKRTWDIAQDWTRDGVKVLSLWFHGAPNNDSEPMYVAVEDTTGMSAVVVHDPGITILETWQGWTICLEEFTNQGVNLTEVNSIAIGFGDRDDPQPGGTGTVYFDDVKLYAPRYEDPQPCCDDDDVPRNKDCDGKEYEIYTASERGTYNITVSANDPLFGDSECDVEATLVEESYSEQDALEQNTETITIPAGTSKTFTTKLYEDDLSLRPNQPFSLTVKVKCPSKADSKCRFDLNVGISYQ